MALRKEKPHWGARKLRELMIRRLGDAVRAPARSTVHAVLDRHGLVKRGLARRPRAAGTPLSEGAAPNDLGCVDFKGEFQLGNRRCCYPLTVTDHAARYLLMCEALTSTREDTAFTAFARLFAERGLPGAIRSDVEPEVRLRRNVALERITPGRPQQNGRHERMHLTLKKETTRPAAMNSLRANRPASTPSWRSSTPSARDAGAGHETLGRSLCRFIAPLRRPARA